MKISIDKPQSITAFSVDLVITAAVVALGLAITTYFDIGSAWAYIAIGMFANSITVEDV